MDFRFRGLMAPVFTPFHSDGSLNLKLIPDYAEYLHANDVTGVLVNGTSGEGVSMTREERTAVLECWMEAARGHGLTVMAHVGGTNMADVKALASHAESVGASAILCLADLFFRPSSVDDLVRYLKIVSESAPSTPLLYYHIPAFTGINIDVAELMRRRHEVPNLVGLKFTDTDLVQGSACVPGNAVFLGCDSLWLAALLVGFDSAIGTTVNLFPGYNNAILRYYKEGNTAAAVEEQKKLNQEIKEIAGNGHWVSTMKAAMRRRTGIDVGPVREPLVDVYHA